MDNHEYQDLRSLDWSDFDEVFAEELELIERLRAGDDLYDEAPGFHTLMLGLDPGVASTVVALAAVGCPPMSSCSGEPGHHEEHPLVVFWCPEERYEQVARAAAGSGATLKGHHPAPGLMVASPRGDLDTIRAFAESLARAAR
jgi:hypothetical protein